MESDKESPLGSCNYENVELVSLKRIMVFEILLILCVSEFVFAVVVITLLRSASRLESFPY